MDRDSGQRIEERWFGWRSVLQKSARRTKPIGGDSAQALAPDRQIWYSAAVFTPLLLPLSNFRSDVLAPQIRTLFDSLGTAENPRVEPGVSKDAILTQHPVNRREGHTPFFQDSRNLRFKSPGRDRHGRARLCGEGHENRCLLNSRVRLGGPFDALFHYDCEYERGGVDRIYPNCHGADAEPAVRTHVNIAPNDAIR